MNIGPDFFNIGWPMMTIPAKLLRTQQLWSHDTRIWYLMTRGWQVITESGSFAVLDVLCLQFLLSAVILLMLVLLLQLFPVLLLLLYVWCCC